MMFLDLILKKNKIYNMSSYAYTESEVRAFFEEEEEQEPKTIKQQVKEREGKRGRKPKNIQIIQQLKEKMKGAGKVVNPIIYAALYVLDKKKSDKPKVADVIGFVEKTLDITDRDSKVKKIVKKMDEWERMELGEKIGQWILEDSADKRDDIIQMLNAGRKQNTRKKFFHQIFNTDAKVQNVINAFKSVEKVLEETDSDLELDDFLSEYEYPKYSAAGTEMYELDELFRDIVIEIQRELVMITQKDKKYEAKANTIKDTLDKFVGRNFLLMPMHSEAIYSTTQLYEYLNDVKSAEEIQAATERIGKYKKMKDEIKKRFEFSATEYEKLIKSIRDKFKDVKFPGEMHIKQINKEAEETLSRIRMDNPYFLYNILKMSKDPISLIVGDVTAAMRQNKYGPYDIQFEAVDRRLFKYLSGNDRVITEQKSKLKYKVII